MNKSLVLAAAIAMAAFIGGPAVANHETLAFVAGKTVMSRTPYCIAESDARYVGEMWRAGGDSAAVTALRTMIVPTDIGINRCGEGRGQVTPIELVVQYERGDKTMNLIRVMAAGIEIEIILLTDIPFDPAGDPV